MRPALPSTCGLVFAAVLLGACDGGDVDETRLIDTSQPGALPVAGTYRATFDGEFSACDVGMANDRYLALREQYVLVFPEDAEEGAEFRVRNFVGDDLFACVRDLSEGSYYCGEVFGQHTGDDSNVYAWTLVHRFVFDTETSGTMTIDGEVTCAGSTCPTEVCEDSASYSVGNFDEFEQLLQFQCAQSTRPQNSHRESLIEVRNLNSQPVELAWVNWDGNPVTQQTVSPGQTVRQRVFAGHSWQARVGSSCLGSWLATDSIGQFDIP
ncbi:MAG: hypothetical protein EP330_21775 [Deltaproteobacteria bacterium]|nr:MAG: hypothetical protein EP330_21775 [Deltaproteobacteria bacterium]